MEEGTFLKHVDDALFVAQGHLADNHPVRAANVIDRLRDAIKNRQKEQSELYGGKTA